MLILGQIQSVDFFTPHYFDRIINDFKNIFFAQLLKLKRKVNF